MNEHEINPRTFPICGEENYPGIFLLRKLGLKDATTAEEDQVWSRRYNDIMSDWIKWNADQGSESETM